MCGIAGIVDFKTDEDLFPIVEEMINLLRHRGPDSCGYYLNRPVYMGHRRLSIIDLHMGDQPISNEDKTVWIIFNGEIFNYPELKRELQSKGHLFYTRTDTEVLVHLYEEKGTEMFKGLNGQFAFALWDAKKETLLLARDRVGIRPLFYHVTGQSLTFASEIKSILVRKEITRKIDPEVLADIFTCWSAFAHETCFKDIFQIPPGHYAIFSKNGMDIKRYWHLDFSGEQGTNDRPLEEWAEELNEIMLDAARIRLRADVPVASYLSGGIDSTYISGLVKKNFNNALRTFSVTFEEKRFSEELFQEKAIKSLETDHSEIKCYNTQIAQLFPKVLWHAETPLLRTGPVPMYALSRIVHENEFKVVLTGEGADEVFAGYNIFKEDKVRRFWAKYPDSSLRPRLLERIYPYIFSQADTRAQAFVRNFFQQDLPDRGSPFYSHVTRWKNTASNRTSFQRK